MRCKSSAKVCPTPRRTGQSLESGSTVTCACSDLPMVDRGDVTLVPVAFEPGVTVSLLVEIERWPDDRYD